MHLVIFGILVPTEFNIVPTFFFFQVSFHDLNLIVHSKTTLFAFTQFVHKRTILNEWSIFRPIPHCFDRTWAHNKGNEVFDSRFEKMIAALTLSCNTTFYRMVPLWLTRDCLCIFPIQRLRDHQCLVHYLKTVSSSVNAHAGQNTL